MSRKKNPARDPAFKQTFEFEGPTLWLLRTVLLTANTARMSKADRVRVDALEKFFMDALYLPRHIHKFDHRKKRPQE